MIPAHRLAAGHGAYRPGRHSQEDFAAVLCMTQSNLSMIETGRYLPSAMLLYLLHASYRINLNWLVSGQGEMVQA